MKTKEHIIYWMIIILLVFALLISIIGFPTYNYQSEGRTCIKWTNPIPNSDGNGNHRYCLKAIKTDNQNSISQNDLQ